MKEGPVSDGPAPGVFNVAAALSTISEYWQPHRLTSVNDYDVKVVKLHGEFVWHTHPYTDELFMVVSGGLTIQLRDRDVVLVPYDVFVVPRGVEHCPKAEEEVHALLPRAARHNQHRRCRRHHDGTASRTRPEA